MEQQKSKPFDPRAQKKEDPRLGVGMLEGAEFMFTVWNARPAIGIAPEQLLVPEYWAHHAHRLTPGDEIVVRSEDSSWYGRLYVLDCARTWAKVKFLLGPVSLTTHDANLQPDHSSMDEVEKFKVDYKLIHRGPRRWSVIRADGAVMHENEQEKSGAEKWLDDYAREQVGAPKAPPEAQA
jgi:hypothetical protein